MSRQEPCYHVSSLTIADTNPQHMDRLRGVVYKHYFLSKKLKRA